MSELWVRAIETLHYFIIVKIIVSNKAKGESKNGCFKKTKHAKFSAKTNISHPLIGSETPVLTFAILSCTFH